MNHPAKPATAEGVLSSPFGDPLPRLESRRLLAGRGRYLDDIEPDQCLHLAIFRSPVPFARLRAITGADVTGADLPAAVNQLPVLYLSGSPRQTSYPVLPTDHARYTGQPLAVCIGPSRYVAEDRLQGIQCDLEPLPAVTALEEALSGNRLLYPDWGSNVAARLDYAHGEDPDQIKGCRVLDLELGFGRSQGMPMEGRGVVALWDPGGRLTVWSSTQAPSQLRTILASVFGLAESRVRVRVPDVGGGFGNKLHVYPEDVLACWVARETGRPVKWVEDRAEHLLSTVHARDARAWVRVYFHDDGRLEGLKVQVAVDVGAHLHTKGMGPAANVGKMVTAAYRIPHLRASVEAVVTNKVPNGAYRGFGQPEATWIIERALDAVARATGLTPWEVRRRTLLGPDDLPWVTATGQRLDSGDYPRALQLCLDRFDVEGFRRRQGQGGAGGRALGMGVSLYLEIGGSAPSQALGRLGRNQGGYERVVARLEPSGEVVLSLGVVDQGQGHATVFAQVAAAVLACPLAQIIVTSGDTDRDPYSGYGTASSRCAVVAGTATQRAAERLRAKLARIASALLEVAPDDLRFADGAVQVAGVPQRRLTFAEIAQAAYSGHRLPPELVGDVSADAVYDPADWTYAYGASAVEVAVDRETGQVEVVRYLLVHDAGTLINPLLAESQTVGGLMQGIGGALVEEHRYDPEGHPLTVTLKDYYLPTIGHLPSALSVVHLVTPSPVTPAGMKGLGEGGAIAPAPAIAQAVEDALGVFGLTHLPLTPDRVLEAISPNPGSTKP